MEKDKSLYDSKLFFKKNLDLDESLYQNIQDFKSIDDFLKKRKKNKKIAFKNKNINLIKLAVDFYLDNQVTPIFNDNDEMSLMSGFYDIQSQPNNERLVSELNYYQKEDYNVNAKKININNNILDLLKIIDPSLLMINDGIESSDLVSNKYYNVLSDNNDGTKLNINNIV